MPLPLVNHIFDSFSTSVALKVSATVFLIIPLSPVLITLSFVLLISLLITIPILCIFISTYLFYSSLSRFSVRSFLKLSLTFCLWILDSSSDDNYTSTKLASGDEICDDNQVSVVFDPSEVPSFDDLEEEEEENTSEESSSMYDHDHDHSEKKERRESISSNASSLNVQPMKSFNPFDDGSFHEILTFWKKKEGERV